MRSTRLAGTLGLLVALAAASAQAQAPERDPAHAAHVEQARAHWRAGRYTESAAAYRRATRIAPRDARSFAGLGRAYAALGAHRYAVPAYRRAIELLDDVPSALHAALAHSLLAMGDHDAARTAFHQALQRDPTNEGARRGYESLGGRMETLPPLRTSSAAPFTAAPSGGPNAALLGGGIALGVAGLGATLGCGIAYGVEPEPVSPSSAAGADPLTWISCMSAGVITTVAGAVLLGLAFAQSGGASRPPTAGELSEERSGARVLSAHASGAERRAGRQVHFDVAPAPGGALASATLAF